MIISRQESILFFLWVILAALISWIDRWPCPEKNVGSGFKKRKILCFVTLDLSSSRLLKEKGVSLPAIRDIWSSRRRPPTGSVASNHNDDEKEEEEEETDELLCVQTSATLYGWPLTNGWAKCCASCGSSWSAIRPFSPLNFWSQRAP